MILALLEPPEVAEEVAQVKPENPAKAEVMLVAALVATEFKMITALVQMFTMGEAVVEAHLVLAVQVVALVMLIGPLVLMLPLIPEVVVLQARCQVLLHIGPEEMGDRGLLL